jgi:hypothetical protein
VTIEPKRYEEIMPQSSETGSAYSFCAHTCLTAVKSWADESQFGGGITYCLETGHRNQSEANQIMTRLFHLPALRASHRYVSHTFADKKKVRALQAADLIAWQWYTDHKRRAERKRLAPRKDCAELMSGSSLFHVLHFEDHMIRTVADTVLRGKFPLTHVARA